MSPSRTVLAAMAVVSLSSSAAAHESWLAASDWEPRPGDEVAVRNVVGSGFAGEAAAFSAGRVKRLLIRQADTRDLKAPETGAARFVLEDDDGALIAYETEFALLKVDGPEFDAYLAEEGLDEPARMRQASGAALEGRPARERYARCAKTWLGGDDGRRVKEPVGLPLEIVPRREPTRVSKLRLQVLFNGRPLAGALVKSWMQPLDAAGEGTDPEKRLSRQVAQHVRTNERGMVRLDVSKRGEYLVSAVHAVRCKDPNVADWDSWWATLAFARGAGRPWVATDTEPLRGTGLGKSTDLGDSGFAPSTTVRDEPSWGRR